MRAIKTALWVTMVTCLMTAASAAWACDVYGTVVCDSDATVEVSGVLVTVTGADGSVVTATSGSDGSFFTHVNSAFISYTVSPGGQTFYCDWGATIQLTPIEVDDSLQCPGPPPPTADCSPGYYKNHPETWCAQCGFANVCTEMIQDLSARGPGSAEIRDAAKALIDQCFGSAAMSPCSDDDS